MKTLRISFVCAGLLSAGLLCQGGGGATGSTVTSITATAEPDSGNLRTFVELVRKDVRAEKAIILAQNIDFTKDEAVDFWPLYSEYERGRLAVKPGYRVRAEEQEETGETVMVVEKETS